MVEKSEGMLSPYRVLDLADEKGLLCGKILGDLGADVIKIERPGGDPARSIAPFYHDEPHPEKSLFWFALNTSKRGVTLNIETADGKEIFKKLVKNADFVIESFPPGYLDKLGLGYRDLEKINPGVIMVSITPFGQTGPYKDYKIADIAAWALGGEMALFGDADRPPFRVGHHAQVYLQAGADGAMGAVAALYQRWISGEGQQVDVSIQEASAQNCSENKLSAWDLTQALKKRGEARAGAGHIAKQLWTCKDGWVCWSYGASTPGRPLFEWMDSEGMADDFLEAFDWERLDLARVPQEEWGKLEDSTARFFMTHTKAELLDGAVKHKVMLYPVSTTADMLENRQLKARNFWVEVEHPELGGRITYPGPFGLFSEASPKISRRAPLIGEHNQGIYEGELGVSKEKLVVLKQAGVI
ncbi:MAG: CoA transferase [Chloroflexi bacterium]|nr:CoA transferase [Chloroflexota bacterium]